MAHAAILQLPRQFRLPLIHFKRIDGDDSVRTVVENKQRRETAAGLLHRRILAFACYMRPSQKYFLIAAELFFVFTIIRTFPMKSHYVTIKISLVYFRAKSYDR